MQEMNLSMHLSPNCFITLQNQNTAEISGVNLGKFTAYILIHFADVNKIECLSSRINWSNLNQYHQYFLTNSAHTVKDGSLYISEAALLPPSGRRCSNPAISSCDIKATWCNRSWIWVWPCLDWHYWNSITTIYCKFN